MKHHFFIGIIYLVYSVTILASDAVNPFPQSGVLDLRETVLDEESLFNLNGEWEFYWEELLSPEDYSDAKNRNSGMVVTIPSYFNSYVVDGKSLPGMGYGTYCLNVLLPEGNESAICFDIPIFDVAYNFYLNERLIGSNGIVGSSREEEEPWYEPSSFCYVPHSDTLRLLIQVSNFHHRRGGFWKPLLMGGSHKVLEKMERTRMYNYSTIGVLFFFTFFFITFWFFSKKQNLMLVFALTAMGILMRSVNTGLYFSNSFVHVPWAWQIRMEYLGSFMALIFGMMFLHRMFPKRYMNAVVRINTLVFSLAGLSLFILPVHLFAYEMLLYQPFILLLLLHYLVISLLGIFRRKVMDAIFFISMAFFMYTLVNDIMLANSAGAIHIEYLSQVSFQLFIFAMSISIIMQWVGNFNERVRLESSLRFKNKVLSVIAHDLKNPVASVAQFSELLATKPELVDKKNILTSLQESSQAAVTLLDNLLYWGRSQADELIVSADDFDVEKLIREVKFLFMHMAAQKEISFTTDVKPGISTFADRALVNIVVRNLVSNAIKFTPRNGSVRIAVRPETGFIRFTVADTGIGINPDILDQFKEQGHLESSSGTESELGTGLGLQLVKDLVEKNGGTLTIESKPKEDSTFTFTLPTSTIAE